MRREQKNRRKQIGTVMVCMLVVLFSCAKDEEIVPQKDASIRFSVMTRTSGDANAITGEDEFRSLAVYVFHNSNTIPERAILLSSVAASQRLQWQDTIAVKPGTKTIYVIGNYAGANLTNSAGNGITLSALTTRTVLEDLHVSNAAFASRNLLMVNSTTVTVGAGDTYKYVPVQLRRLQARLDLYVYKGSSLAASNVELLSVTLNNRVTASEVKFGYDPATAVMPSPVPTASFIYTPPSTRYLPTFPGALSVPVADTIATMYSYQNIITATSPLPSTTPSLTVAVRLGGVVYTYNGYLGDNSQTQYKYSFLQNNIYRIYAVVEDANQLILHINAAPWDIRALNINRVVTASDCIFTSWGGSWGGTYAKTIRSVTNSLTDATFSFELKAPQGASWVATLTNGLDFSFSTPTSGISTPGLSRGVARPGIPYLIAVRANKPWSGQIRQAELYITVNGVEIPINPTVGGVRTYPGSSDTRVLIKQVFSTSY